MRTDLRHLKRLLEANNAGLLLEKFEQRWDLFERRLKQAKQKPSEDAVHNLRVTSRRLLSLLTLLEAVLPPLNIRPPRRTIRKRLRSLRAMRDVQVQILHIEKLLADFPQLSPFHKSLIRKEQQLARRVLRELRSVKKRRFRESMESLREAIVGSLDPDADRALGGRIGTAIEDAFRQVLSLRAQIGPHETASIHRTRLAFKNFRYMAEIAAPIFPQLDQQRLRAMHSYQERMGTIQDVESLLSTLTDFRRRSGGTSILVVENEVRRIRQRHIDEFMKTIDEVRFFWSRPKTHSREVS